MNCCVEGLGAVNKECARTSELLVKDIYVQATAHWPEVKCDKSVASQKLRTR